MLSKTFGLFKHKSCSEVFISSKSNLNHVIIMAGECMKSTCRNRNFHQEIHQSKPTPTISVDTSKIRPNNDYSATSSKDTKSRTQTPYPLIDLPLHISEQYNLPADIANAILYKLNSYQRKHDVKIIHCVETGSRSYGYNCDATSDFDIRLIFVGRTLDYLKLRNNFPEFRSSKNERIPEALQHIFRCNSNSVRSIDIVGWELRKALVMTRKANPSIIDVLASNKVLAVQTSLLDKWKSIAAQVIHNRPHPFAYSKLSTAKKNYLTLTQANDSKSLDVKKTLMIIHLIMNVNILEWMYLINSTQTNVVHPLDDLAGVNFHDIFSKLRRWRTLEIEKEIEELVALRQQAPSTPLSSMLSGKRIDSWIQYELARLEIVANQLRECFTHDEQPIVNALDTLFLEILAESEPSPQLGTSLK
ncbi:hypothetical protein C9374_000762 [Naegleria lovaniensis]|uniref:Nucleotidyltransferase n=1 Tax=Naegleria lovaniensis TaxID=51637 RepID=A0AA88KSD3_NAELO|nr:uncharacterized protein C9374_000762 [Naegleria lovaniensis]KAG2387912.1 hypothetical protein C9374_000762 [Naegleria lovaniensis]